MEEGIIDRQRRYTYALCGILLLAVCLRLIGLGKGLWLDEAYSVSRIRLEGWPHMLRSLKDDVHPPVYYLLLRLWSTISYGEEFLRLLSVLFSLVAVGFIALWMKQYSKTASLLAALYCATAPLLLRYSQEIRQYALLFLATVVSFFFASRIAEQPQNRNSYVFLSLSLLFAVSVHLNTIFLVVPISVFIIVSCKDISWMSVGKVLLAVAPGCVLFLVYLFVLTSTADQNASWMPEVTWEVVWRNSAALLGLLNAPWPMLLLSLCVGVCLFFGSWKRSFSFLLAAALFFLQILIYSMVAVPVFFFRSLIPLLIPLTGFVALQIATISRKKIRFTAAAICLVLYAGFSIEWVRFQAKQPVEAFKEAAGVVKSQWRPNSSVLVYPDYVQLPVRHYLGSLPGLVSAAPSSPRGDLFVMVRPDSIFVSDWSRFSRFLAVLKNRNGNYSSMHVFVILCGDRFVDPRLVSIAPKVSDHLTALFGQPIYSHDYGLYSVSSWRGI